MKKIIIYSSSLCSYCIAAKKLLEQQNLSFEEKNIDFDKQLKNEMIKKSSGKKTVPQIFFDNYHVGGCDELFEIYNNGNLTKLLKNE